MYELTFYKHVNRIPDLLNPHIYIFSFLLFRSESYFSLVFFIRLSSGPDVDSRVTASIDQSVWADAMAEAAILDVRGNAYTIATDYVAPLQRLAQSHSLIVRARVQVRGMSERN